MNSVANDTDTKNLETVKLEGSANVQFMRNYNLDYLNIGMVQSLIRPQINYSFISNNSYRDIPLIDPYDRIGKCEYHYLFIQSLPQHIHTSNRRKRTIASRGFPDIRTLRRLASVRCIQRFW